MKRKREREERKSGDKEGEGGKVKGRLLECG